MRLIQPIFASTNSSSSGLGAENGIYDSGNGIVDRVKKDIDLGVNEFLLFYIPENKLLNDKHNFLKVSRVAQQLAKLNIKLNVDVCLCAYTEDGHCCITGDDEKTEELLTEQAVTIYEMSGATVAPSDCQPNTVKNIKNANKEIPVMSYSTKFRSSFYSGWRNVMGIEKGIVRPYQLDVSDRDKAIIKSVKYADDGADELMVKPGMTSIDLIGPIKQITGKPCGAFQVSGEWLSITTPEQLLETYHVFERADADYMISYGARKLCGLV